MQIANGAWVFFLLTLLWASRTPAQEEVRENVEGNGRLRLRASPLLDGFHFDGKLTEDVWRTAVDSIPDLVTIEPEEGGVPAGRTVVKVLVGQEEIVVGAQCFDNDPKGIVSFSKARDSVLDEEDHLVLVFDTFLDARSGYVFALNPSNARFDAVVVDREEVNSEWDTVWEARTSRDAHGWSAEIRIPILSLGFAKGLTEWGFNVQRRVQRLQETSRWSGASIDYEIYQTSRSGLLTDLPLFDLGKGLSIRASAVGRTRTSGLERHRDNETDLSLDMTQKLGSNLSSALTINTDFAETEVDVRQINLTRFPIFFPEKRSFFLEGVDIFEFGLGLDPEENLLPFFSRRIGLFGLDEEEQVEIPINAGGKINGRVGNTNIGALVANTREVDALQVDPAFTVAVPQTTMGAMRISQNLWQESSVGMIATVGDQLGREGAWLAGVDFTYQTSSFRWNKNLLIGAWGLFNDRADLSGDKSAHGFRIEYPNDLWDVNFSSIHIGNGFDPSLGFVPRNNIHIWDFGLEVSPRPASSWLRQMFLELSGTAYKTADNSEWESYAATVKPLDWLLESGERFDLGLEVEGDRPSEVFEISSDVDVPPGSYEWARYFIGARAAEKRRISGEVRWDFGTYYDGDLSTLTARLTLKPSALLTVEFTGERSKGDVIALIDDYETQGMKLTEKNYTEELYGGRLQLNLTADLQFSSLTQYDTQSRELGTNNKLRWTFDPLGDVFIVYNYNVQQRYDPKLRKATCWEFISSELPVKVQYARRF